MKITKKEMAIVPQQRIRTMARQSNATLTVL
jgi:hypothetical protein